MKKLILSTLISITSLNSYGLDCTVNTDLQNDGQYDDLVANVTNVQDQNMLIILKDGSVHRQENIEIGQDKNFSILNKTNKSFEGSRIISFGIGSSNVLVTAKHIPGSATDFQSLSATAFAPSSQYGILLDYTNKFMITCN